jgi:hypothetical protein
MLLIALWPGPPLPEVDASQALPASAPMHAGDAGGALAAEPAGARRGGDCVASASASGPARLAARARGVGRRPRAGRGRDRRGAAVRRAEDDLFGRRRATTDAAGLARFQELPPGRVFLEPRRGDAGTWKEAQIQAGREVEAISRSRWA